MVAYFVITTITSIAATVAMGVQGILSDSIAMNSGTASMAPESIDLAGYLTDIMNLSLILSLCLTVILYLLSYFIMRRKINLS